MMTSPILFWCVVIVGGIVIFLWKYQLREKRLRIGGKYQAQLQTKQGDIEQLAQVNGHLLAVLDGMVEGVLVCDAQSRVLRVNPAVCAMFGWTKAPVGKVVAECITRKEVRQAIQRVLLHGEASDCEVDVGDGERQRQFAVQCSPVREVSGVLSVVAVFTDVTRMRKLERVRREFVANVSHELKTPLTSIRGYAEVLQDGALEDSEAARGFVDKIAANALQLQQLVEDILQLASIESGKWRLHRESLSLASWLKQFCAAHRAAECCTIQVANDDRIRVDPRALQLIMTNLLDNALKYSPEPAQITLLGRKVDAGYRLTVRDRGVGIPAEELPLIFARFYRVDKSRTSQHGSSGLGLAIVKNLMRAHGGDVEVQSVVGEMTSFTLTFPE